MPLFSEVLSARPVELQARGSAQSCRGIEMGDAQGDALANLPDWAKNWKPAKFGAGVRNPFAGVGRVGNGSSGGFAGAQPRFGFGAAPGGVSALGVVFRGPGVAGSGISRSPAPPAAPFRVGGNWYGFRPATEFTAKYEEGDALGAGAFGRVFVARERATGATFAAKVIPKTWPAEATVDGPPSASQLMRYNKSIYLEVDALRRLRGALNVVYMEEVYENEDSVYLITELCHGGPIWAPDDPRTFGEAQVARYMRDVLQVLAQCHAKHLLHRDVKPGNFLLATKHPRAPLKAIDLGLAAPFTPGQPREDLGLDGTPYYLAPEVLRSETWPKSDVWQAGVMAYQLLTGSLPFSDHGPRGSRSIAALLHNILNDDIDAKIRSLTSLGLSEDARDFVHSLLSRDLGKRPTAVEALGHPFLTLADGGEGAGAGGERGGERGGRVLGPEVVARIQRFCQAPAFKRSVLVRVAREMMGMGGVNPDTGVDRRPIDPADGDGGGGSVAGSAGAGAGVGVGVGVMGANRMRRASIESGSEIVGRGVGLGVSRASMDSGGGVGSAGWVGSPWGTHVRVGRGVAMGQRGLGAVGRESWDGAKGGAGAGGSAGVREGRRRSVEDVRSKGGVGSAAGSGGRAGDVGSGAGLAWGGSGIGSLRGSRNDAFDAMGEGAVGFGEAGVRSGAGSEGAGESGGAREGLGLNGGDAPSLLRGVRALFDELDMDADGTVTLRELRRGLKRHSLFLTRDEARHMLEALDVDSDGRVSMAAFVASVIDWRAVEGTAEWMRAARKVFQGMDTDNCGSLGLSSILSTLQVSLPPDEVRSAVAEALMEAGVVDHVDWYEKPTVDESIRAGRAFAKGGRPREMLETIPERRPGTDQDPTTTAPTPTATPATPAPTTTNNLASTPPSRPVPSDTASASSASIDNPGGPSLRDAGQYAALAFDPRRTLAPGLGRVSRQRMDFSQFMSLLRSGPADDAALLAYPGRYAVSGGVSDGALSDEASHSQPASRDSTMHGAWGGTAHGGVGKSGHGAGGAFGELLRAAAGARGAVAPVGSLGGSLHRSSAVGGSLRGEGSMRGGGALAAIRAGGLGREGSWGVGRGAWMGEREGEGSARVEEERGGGEGRDGGGAEGGDGGGERAREGAGSRVQRRSGRVHIAGGGGMGGGGGGSASGGVVGAVSGGGAGVRSAVEVEARSRGGIGARVAREGAMRVAGGPAKVAWAGEGRGGGVTVEGDAGEGQDMDGGEEVHGGKMYRHQGDGDGGGGQA